MINLRLNRNRFLGLLGVIFVLVVLGLSLNRHSTISQTTDTLHQQKNDPDSLEIPNKLKNLKGDIVEPKFGPTKGVILLITKTSEMYHAKKTIRQIEDRFNHKYHYPYVLLNNEPFSREFIEHTSAMTQSYMEYGIIPNQHWDVPENIDMKKVEEAMKEMDKLKIIHGGSLEYRQLQRYWSGFFYKHPLLKKYDYYWRAETGSSYLCDFDFDPFERLKSEEKTYSFVIPMTEFEPTIPSLWGNVTDYLQKVKPTLPEDNALGFITDDNKKTYNLCHFWSNFELADLNFFRSEAYQKFFDHMDKSGGFFYERWGDAPIHTIGATLLQDKKKIWFMEEMGYSHTALTQCPQKPEFRRKCACEKKENFNDNNWSCLPKWKKLMGQN